MSKKSGNGDSGVVRPYPPADFGWFAPAPEVLAWIKTQILAKDGYLYNPDHDHLIDADVQILWSGVENISKQRQVLGQCEKVFFKGGAWSVARQELQMIQWFGDVPDFLITLDANYCSECDDAEFCALVEHELYHIAQALDKFGAPRFNQQTGEPVFAIRGHDVEEFVGVVRRYGASSAVQKMVEAAKGRPEVAGVNIAKACGTCLMRVA